MFFTAFDSEGASSTSLYGRELWRSDGTEAGTFMIKDILPGSGGSIYSLNEYTAYNGKVLFGANDGSTGDELWETDGTEAGTQLLKDIRVGNLSGNPFLPHAKIFNELCYFTYSSVKWVRDLGLEILSA